LTLDRIVERTVLQAEYLALDGVNLAHQLPSALAVSTAQHSQMAGWAGCIHGDLTKPYLLSGDAFIHTASGEATERSFPLASSISKTE